jgi:SAM-dependent methyltransferase
VASDIATGYLEQVKKNASSQSVNVETVRCDVEKDLAQLAGREFDYIFFMDVIEHLRSPLTGLENIRHLLSDNGWLFIHTPNACSVWRIYALIMNRARTCRVLDASQVKDLHLQLYDLQSLSQLCNFAGLEVTRILPTRLVVPILGNSRFLAKRLPALGDTLLLECRKCPPIDVKEVVDHWLCSLDSERTSAVKS